MRVLQVIDTLNVGGAERVFVDMANILANAGVPTEVLLLKARGPLKALLDQKLTVHDLRRENKYSLAKALKTHSLCKRFDIVHVHMRHCYAYIRTVQLAFGGKYKIILHDHYGDIGIDKYVPRKLRSPFKPYYYIAVSQNLYDWAANSLKPQKKFLLRNIIVPKPNMPHINSKNGRALMVANIRPTKNIEFAIELCKKLTIDLDIYGNRSDYDYYIHLQEKIADYPNINIIEGVTDFSELYQQYSLALHTAKSETGPLVLLEYMAYGIPFISYKTGEVANAVFEELAIHFIDNFDVAQWEKRIREIQEIDGLSSKLQTVFRNNFSVDNYLRECLQIYSDISS